MPKQYRDGESSGHLDNGGRYSSEKEKRYIFDENRADIHQMRMEFL